MSSSSTRISASISDQPSRDDGRRGSIPQTIKNVSCMPNSFLSLTTKWKDLEEELNCIQEHLYQKNEEIESKSKKLEWKGKYIQRKARDIRNKEAQLENRLKMGNDRCAEIDATYALVDKCHKVVQEKTVKCDRRLREIRREAKSLNSRKSGLKRRMKKVKSREEELDDREDELRLPGSPDMVFAEELDKKQKNLEIVESALAERDDMIELEKKRLHEENNGLETNPDDCAIKINVTIDGRALQMFLSQRVRDHDALRDEVLKGLSMSSNPPKLVLDAMKGFYAEDTGNEEGVLDLIPVRKSCILVLEQMSKLKPCIMLPDKDRALRLAFEWKGKMQVDRDHYLEVTGFLQLVASFELTSIFDKEELAKLFEIAAIHDQAAQLCHNLGTQAMVPEIIQNLIEDDQRLAVIKLVYAFELVEAFPPVPILEGHLTYISSVAKRIYSEEPCRKEEALLMKLNAVRAVCACLIKYNLMPSFPLQRLKEQFVEAKKEAFELDMANVIDEILLITATELAVSITGSGNTTISESTSVSQSARTNTKWLQVAVPSESEFPYNTAAEQVAAATCLENTAISEFAFVTQSARMNKRQPSVLAPSESRMPHNAATEQVVTATSSRNTAISEFNFVSQSVQTNKKGAKVVISSEDTIRQRIDHPSYNPFEAGSIGVGEAVERHDRNRVVRRPRQPTAAIPSTSYQRFYYTPIYPVSDEPPRT